MVFNVSDSISVLWCNDIPFLQISCLTSDIKTLDVTDFISEIRNNDTQYHTSYITISDTQILYPIPDMALGVTDFLDKDTFPQ